MTFDESWLAARVGFLVPLIISLTVHEWAHAWVAKRLGDDLAERQDRLTLNPLAHIDPVGSVLLPVLGVPFGWAKPVPVNPARLGQGMGMRQALLLVALAGPLSNLCIAAICAAATVVLSMLQLTSGPVTELLETLLLLNVILAIGNLLPIPPLDGSRVVDALVPHRLRPLWDQYCAAGPLVLGALMVALVSLSLSV